LAFHWQQWPHHDQSAALHQPRHYPQVLHAQHQLPPKHGRLRRDHQASFRANCQLESTSFNYSLSHSAEQQAVDAGGDPVLSDILHAAMFDQLCEKIMLPTFDLDAQALPSWLADRTLLQLCAPHCIIMSNSTPLFVWLKLIHGSVAHQVCEAAR
jgi:hypothetical protein